MWEEDASFECRRYDERMAFFIIIFGIPLLSQFVSSQMRKRFVQFSNQPVSYSGREIAEMMLADHGINHVRVISTAGQLTDHYDPVQDTVNLSQPVYEQRNVAAAAVAAHECGHAVQDATQYSLLMARTKMVPILKMSNLAVPVLCFGGAGVTEMVGMHGTALLCGLGFGLPALFSLITLPVEFDASRRALDWMEQSGLTRGDQFANAKKSLFWAAMTYVVAALGSIIQAWYFAKMFVGPSRSR